MSESAHGHLNDIVTNQFSESPATDSATEVSQALDSQNESISTESEASEASEESGNDEFSRKFAALSRKDKEVREREASMGTEMEALKAELEELRAAQAPKEEVQLPLDYRLKRNPLKVLEEMGLSYDKLTELALNDGNFGTEDKMRHMREDLESKYENKFKDLEERLAAKDEAAQQETEEAAIESFKHNIESTITSNPEKFELVAANNASYLVFDVIEEQYNETGRVLDIEEAADAVESYLYEEATKLMKAKKLSAHLGAPKPVSREQSPPTLSNAHSAQAINRADSKLLSRDESVADVAHMLKWND